MTELATLREKGQPLEQTGGVIPGAKVTLEAGAQLKAQVDNWKHRSQAMRCRRRTDQTTP